MLKQLRPIIGDGKKVQIIHGNDTFLVKKQDLYNKVKILCQKREDLELNFILGAIIAMKAINLKEGKIYCYFQEKNVEENRPELIIQKQSDLYKLLKGMKDFD